MKNTIVSVTVIRAWYVVPAFNIAGFFAWLAGTGISVKTETIE
jgi:hypothetical protein